MRLDHLSSVGPPYFVNQEGYSAGSWRRSPWTIHVRLDHGGPTVVLEGETRISASGARRRRAPWSARSSGNRRARHLTRAHVCQRYVLAGQVTCSRVRVRSRGLSDVLASRGASRHARRRPTMQDDQQGRSGAGRGTVPTTGPSPRPSRSTSSKPAPNNLPGGVEADPRGSRIGDVTSARIVPGGLARIERRWIPSR